MRKPIIQKIIKNISKKISYASLKMVCIAFFCATIFGTAAQAEIKHQADLSKIEQYLNNLKFLSADFSQSTNDGETNGKFFLARPGRMRVEYNQNPKILIVVNESVLTYHDIELDEISNLATNTTPASFLTRKNISFAAKDVEITSFEKNNEFTKVSVIKKNRKEAGEFSLIFKNNPFEFYKMQVKNDLDEVTEITLSNIDFEKKLS